MTAPQPLRRDALPRPASGSTGPAGAAVDAEPRPEVAAPAEAPASGGAWVPWAFAALAVALRLPFLGAPVAPDEGGYLVVASQWHHGSSVYGSYFVDRPPLLLTIFRFAAETGGLTSLRLIGCLGAAVTVVATGATLRRVVGPSAVTVGCLVAAVLLGSAQFGAGRVNGELLAAPFSALGIALAVAALGSQPSPGRRRAVLAAVGVGAAACAAMLVKQNMAEAVVFAVVVWLLGWRSGAIGGRRVVLMLGSAVAGGTAVVVATAAWTVLHGTSLSWVFYASYPFRLRAGEVLANAGSTDASRFSTLLSAWLTSMTPLFMVALLVLVLARRLRGPVPWAVLATGVYAAFSVLMGGSFWTHYLVELDVPVALAAGLVASTAPTLASRLCVPVVAVALVVTLPLMWRPVPAPGTVIGRDIAAASHPGDTVVTAYGDADLVYSAHLPSPYPFLWSLPAHVLDRHTHRLARLLASPQAPTWLVVENPKTGRRIAHEAAGTVLSSEYHPVGRTCDRVVYLRDGLTRQLPPLARHCLVPSTFGGA